MLIILLFLWVWEEMCENQLFLMQYYTKTGSLITDILTDIPILMVL